MKSSWTLAIALAVAPALARAEEKTTTTTTSKDAARTAGNPMKTPDTDNTRDKATSSSDPKMTDTRLVALLHHVDQEEISAGKLAQKMGKSSDVQAYGQKLITDHTKADKDLMAAAKKAGITPSKDALTMKDKEEAKVDMNKMDQLKQMSGAEFDRTFAQVMSQDHDHVISMLRDHKNDVQSPELKQLVTDLMPILQSHKDMADKVMRSVGQSGSAAQGRSPSDPNRRPSQSSDSATKSDTSSSSSGSSSDKK
jgi:putative membrane protein